MSWTKKIDRRKFPRAGMVICTFDHAERVWRAGMWPTGEVDDDPIAGGIGPDPLAAVLEMTVNLGALTESGEWKP